MRRAGLAVVALFALSGVLSSCTADDSRGRSAPTDDGRRQAERSLRSVFDVDGSDWTRSSRDAGPASAECTIDGDPHAGRQYHWNAAGSAPADPERWIETVVQTLRGQDRTVSVRSADVGKYGTLHQATADDDGQPLVVVTANSRTTTVTVESVCVAAPDAEAD